LPSRKVISTNKQLTFLNRFHGIHPIWPLGDSLCGNRPAGIVRCRHSLPHGEREPACEQTVGHINSRFFLYTFSFLNVNLSELYRLWPHLLSTGGPLWFILAPLYYFYVKALLAQPIRWNRFSILHAQLLNKENGEHTLLAIALDAGFNSKTSFNRAFKDHTGMTTTEYVRKQTADQVQQ